MDPLGLPFGWVAEDAPDVFRVEPEDEAELLLGQAVAQGFHEPVAEQEELLPRQFVLTHEMRFPPVDTAECDAHPHIPLR
jgi:hypothetical protein